MEFISVEIPGHFRTNIPLHSRNVLVLLEYGWRKIKHKDMSSLWEHNATHSHESIFHSNSNRRHCQVWRKLNEKYHASVFSLL